MQQIMSGTMTTGPPAAASAANVGASVSARNNFIRSDVSQCAIGAQSPRRSSIICCKGEPVFPVRPRSRRSSSLCNHASRTARGVGSCAGLVATTNCSHANSDRCCDRGSDVTTRSISTNVLMSGAYHDGRKLTSLGSWILYRSIAESRASPAPSAAFCYPPCGFA